MVKVIRVPLTDRYNRDFTTGKIVELPPVKQEMDLEKKLTKWKSRKLEEARSLGRDDGRILVEGLGWVSL